MQLTIISPGKGHKWPKRKHTWVPVPDQKIHWNEETMGKRFEEIDMDSHYAVYRTLYRCPCGAESVISEVGLI